jgi:hypothetical protein
VTIECSAAEHVNEIASFGASRPTIRMAACGEHLANIIGTDVVSDFRRQSYPHPESPLTWQSRL